MKHSRKIINLIIGSFVLLFVFSCVKDSMDFDKLTNEVHWKPSLSAPIAYGNLSMAKGIETYDSAGYLRTNADGYLSMIYHENVESDTVSELMDIGNQQLSATIPSAGIDWTNFDSQGDEKIVTRNFDLNFDLFNPDAELDSIWLDQGLMKIAAISSYQHSIQLTITLPTLRNSNNQPYTETLNLLPNGSVDSASKNIADYDLDLTQTSQGYNEIPVELSLKFIYSGGNNTGDLDLQVDLLNPDHKAMFGYFGHNTLIYESGKIEIDLFDLGENWELEDFEFKDPKFKVKYKNSYGIPTNFYFDSISAYSTFHDQHYDLNDFSGGLPMDSLNPYKVTYPNIFGAEAEDSLQVDKSNSNIKTIVGNRPSSMKFIAHAHTNPGGAANHSNFVWNDSRFFADVKLELPLWGYIDRFHGYDTADFNLEEEFEDPGMIERLMLRLNIDNGLPVKAEAQVYFLDENNFVLDSIFKGNNTNILAAAQVDNNGKVISKSKKTVDITVTDDLLDKVMNTKYILYKASSSTTSAGADEPIKIYPEYEVDFDAAVEADLDYEVDLDTIE